MNIRQKEILKAIIELYTESALPVGSQNLLAHYDFNVSSATLRNDMAYLEKEGYLYQPHTSAGRIPTDLGYRTYVEEMMGDELLSKTEQRHMQTELLSLRAKHARTARTTAKLLSAFSGNLAVAGILDQDEYYDFGMKDLLTHPEFREIDELCQLVEALDTMDTNIDRLLDAKNQAVQIYIGSENPITEIQNCSMIIAPFESPDGKGILAIIGPKRMHYARNKSLIEYMQRLLSDNQKLLGSITLTIGSSYTIIS
jgi:transcriptional regulator of heat shock response